MPQEDAQHHHPHVELIRLIYWGESLHSRTSKGTPFFTKEGRGELSEPVAVCSLF